MDTELTTKEAAEILGVTAKRLRELRSTLHEEDFELQTDGRTRYTETGWKALLAAANGTAKEGGPPTPPPPAIPPPGPVEGAPLMARVIGRPNPRLLVGQLEDGRRITIRVQHSGRFQLWKAAEAETKPTMLVPVRYVRGELYELARRGPRWFGRW